MYGTTARVAGGGGEREGTIYPSTSGGCRALQGLGPVGTATAQRQHPPVATRRASACSMRVRTCIMRPSQPADAQSTRLAQVLGAWDGLAPGLLKTCPYTACQLGIYELSRGYLSQVELTDEQYCSMAVL